ncbi:Heterokaryon incompatibility protein (HET) domain containing protein [Rhypophila decipiens]
MPRLLHVQTRQFKEFIGQTVPPYAILSHTWGLNELTFKDVQGLAISDTFPKDSKIDGCCARALQDGYEYVWIDTICIDKSSSAELSEAINSMFDWYYNSGVCYAYLSDVDPGEDPLDPRSSFHTSRWFTRGWTLQELLAPGAVLFFDSGWNYIGRKQLGPDRSGHTSSYTVSDDHGAHDFKLMELVAHITKIPATVLQSGNSRLGRFRHHSIAEKMSWACRREVTRQEDEAYSLLGLFQINMPLLYGEGDRAFQRLQNELIRVSDDETIFAWGFRSTASSYSTRRSSGSLLASSLLDFEVPDGMAIVRKQTTHASRSIRSDHYQATNKGILLRKPVRAASRGDVALHLVPLRCLAIQITNDGPPKSSSSGGFFHWDESLTLAVLVRSLPNDHRTHYRASREPISVSSGVFAGKKIKEIYVTESLESDAVVIPTRIFHINRPPVIHHCAAGLGIRLNSFYPPGMQALNPFGHNSLLVHCYTLAQPRSKDKMLWAGWRQKLRPEMRDTVYFVHFNGLLGSFLVMVFPVDGPPDGSSGDQDSDLPFIPLDTKTSDHVSKTTGGRTKATWQLRVARLTPGPLKITLKDKLKRLVRGKKPQLTEQLTDMLESESSVDPRNLAWAKALDCHPFQTLRFEVTGQVSDSWTMAMEMDLHKEVCRESNEDLIRKVRKYEFGKLITTDPFELEREAHSYRRAEKRAVVPGGGRSSASGSADWSSVTPSLVSSSDQDSLWGS